MIYARIDENKLITEVGDNEFIEESANVIEIEDVLRKRIETAFISFENVVITGLKGAYDIICTVTRDPETAPYKSLTGDQVIDILKYNGYDVWPL